MKKVIYSTQRSGFEKGAEYRNPAWYSAPLGKPDLVVVIGNYPNIAADYEALGCVVEKRGVACNNVPPIPASLAQRFAAPTEDHAIGHLSEEQSGAAIHAEEATPAEVPAVAVENLASESEAEEEGTDLYTLTAPQLRKYAASYNIDVSDARGKTALIDAIQAHFSV